MFGRFAFSDENICDNIQEFSTVSSLEIFAFFYRKNGQLNIGMFTGIKLLFDDLFSQARKKVTSSADRK